MKLHLATVLLVFPLVSLAQDPPFIYGTFGYQPAGWQEGELSGANKKDIEDCKVQAKAQSPSAGDTDEKLAGLYGFKPAKQDYYGVTLTGCLADEKHGKGWIVLRRSDNDWEKVKSRYAVRTFLGLDPAK